MSAKTPTSNKANVTLEQAALTSEKFAPYADKIDSSLRARFELAYNKKADLRDDSKNQNPDEQRKRRSQRDVEDSSLSSLVATQQMMSAQIIAAQAALLAQQRNVTGSAGGDSSAIAGVVATGTPAIRSTDSAGEDNQAREDDLRLEDAVGDSVHFFSNTGSSSNVLLPSTPDMAAALLHQSQETPRQQRQEQQREGKGLLAELIQELVECLHVSERMRSDDWSMTLKLKSDILQGARLHLENYGRKLNVKLVTADRETYRLLSTEREGLQEALRGAIDHDIFVETEHL